MAIRSEFTVGGALRLCFGILRRQAGVVFSLAAVLYALPTAIHGVLPSLLAIPNAATLRAAAAAGRPAPSLVPLFAFGLAAVVLQVAVAVLSALAIAWVASERRRGRAATFGGGVAAAGRALPAGVGASALIALGLFVGFALLVVPGVMLMLRWAVALPALAVERPGPLGSMGWSRDLTQGHRWAVLGFLVVMTLVYGILAALGFGAGLVAGVMGRGAASEIAVAVAGFVGDAVFAGISGAASAALYLALREAEEGGPPAETVEIFA